MPSRGNATSDKKHEPGLRFPLGHEVCAVALGNDASRASLKSKTMTFSEAQRAQRAITSCSATVRVMGAPDNTAQISGFASLSNLDIHPLLHVLHTTRVFLLSREPSRRRISGASLSMPHVTNSSVYVSLGGNVANMECARLGQKCSLLRPEPPQKMHRLEPFPVLITLHRSF